VKIAKSTEIGKNPLPLFAGKLNIQTDHMFKIFPCSSEILFGNFQLILDYIPYQTSRNITSEPNLN